MTFDKDDGNWHLDKRVPIAIIVTLCAQVFFGVWYASKLDSRVSSLESYRVDMQTAVTQLNNDRESMGTRLTRVEDQTSSILSIVRRIDARQTGAPLPKIAPLNGDPP